MLESGDSEQLESWWNYHQLEPWGDEYQRTSVATARLINIVKQESQKFQQNSHLRPVDLVRDDFIVPKFRKKQPTRKHQMQAAVENLARITL